MGSELLQHLLIPYPLAKCNHNRGIGDMRDGVANLGEPLDELAQRLPRTLLDSVEVGLVAWPGVSALEVGRELAAQLWPGVEGSLGQVHEPGPGRPGQGNGEVVGHNGLIPSCRKDRGGVNLQELRGVDGPVVLLR
jgi:hypothetical protein